MRKISYAAFLAMSFLVATNVYAATATGYEPLVQIPGVPTGEVNISKYLIGIYNFLLSIVGIVAVVMLILGGMKYITAAGSGGAVSGAKETIKDALFGLLLALLSYVILGTINPDVLYLRQPGANFTKEAITPSSSINGRVTKNPDGSITINNPDGTSTIMTKEQMGNYTADEIAQLINSGKLMAVTTAEQQIAAMNASNSCIAPNSPKDNKDPSYTGHCVCVVGRRITMPSDTTSCSEACRKQDLCGYKFLSIKLNARHGYSADDENKYTLTSDTAVHSDELWEITQTNDPKWGDFDITFADETKQYEQTAYHIFPCAILVTNEEEFAADQHFVYWVGLGTTVGEKGCLFDDMNSNYMGNCGSGMYGISAGRCDQAWTDRVIKAQYSDDIVDKCKFCDLADDGSIGKAYRFMRTLTCRGGYWQ